MRNKVCYYSLILFHLSLCAILWIRSIHSWCYKIILYHWSGSLVQESIHLISYLVLPGSEQPRNESCFLECKSLTTSDYIDLTWTTFAEFPGELINYTSAYLTDIYYSRLSRWKIRRILSLFFFSNWVEWLYIFRQESLLGAKNCTINQ